MTHRLAWAPLVFILACAQAGPRPSAAPAPTAQPDWAKLFERELEPLPRVAVVSSNGKTRAEVEAKGVPAVKAEGQADSIEIPLGTGEPIRCVLQHDRMDGASSIWRMWNAVKTQFETRPIRPIEVELAGENPVLFSEHAYFVQKPDGKKGGHIKVAAVVNPRHSLLCNHDEPGYSVTFRRVVRELAASLATSEGSRQRTDARFSEIELVKVGDHAVGFSELLLWERKDGGGNVIEGYVILVLPREMDLQGSDVVRQVLTDPAGRVEEENSVTVENGEMTSQVHLTRAEGGKTYRFEGTKSTKPISGTFSTSDGLASEVMQATLIRGKLLGAKAAKVEVDEYLVDANPTGATHTVYRLQGSTPPIVSAESGTVRYTFAPDENGWVRRAEVPMGSQAMVFERAWSHGAP